MTLLDPDALLRLLPTLLPRASHDGDGPSSASPSSSSSPTSLRHASDALALLLHTVMVRLSFRLVGLSDADRLPSPPSTPEPLPSSTSTSTITPLPDSWNSHAPDSYGFRYRHDQSSLDYLVKLTRMGDRIIVNGLALQGTHTSTLTVPLSDYFSPSFFPATLAAAHDEAARQIRGAFTSIHRCNDLVTAFKNSIVVPLVPNLQKEGFQPSSTTDTLTSSSQPRSGAGPGTGGASVPPPRSPYSSEPPDTSSYPGVVPFRNPLVIGDRDLDPLGGASPSLPSPFGGRHGIFGGGEIGAPPPFPGGPGGMGIPDAGGGMYVGPNHPMFRDRFQNPQGLGGPGGLGGGMVPPGARFDPIGPGGFPGAGGGQRGPDVGGARPQPRGGSGEPDWDELRPPGNVS
ncbi:hypothetical protein ACQY0O_002051 [Thecaphora frezii]